VAAGAAAAFPDRVPRSVRDRPSGLKAAAHRLRRRPAAGPDPGDLCGPWRQATGAGHSLPRQRATPARGRQYRPTKRVFYQQRCKDPLNPGSE